MVSFKINLVNIFFNQNDYLLILKGYINRCNLHIIHNLDVSQSLSYP